MSSIDAFFPDNLSLVKKTVQDGLVTFDGGELFVEDLKQEVLSLKDGVVKQYNVSASKGFGLRGFTGSCSAMVCSSDVDQKSIATAVSSLRDLAVDSETHVHTLSKRKQNILSSSPPVEKHNLYTDSNSIDGVPFNVKFELVQKLELMARKKEPAIQHIMVNLGISWQNIKIIREDGIEINDIRPLIRIVVFVVVVKNGSMGQGRAAGGGRVDYHSYVNDGICEKLVDEAISEACANIEAKLAPAGEMTVVLGPGWPGILLHEAVGHGLESDFNRKKSSVFCESIGKMVAAECITVVDDGTIYGRRGSINVDDEGTTSQRNVLIERGMLVGYMHDRLNANLMGVQSTGNGRRDGYDSLVMPRMTNTFMTCGEYDHKEIISSVKHGLYAVNFGGGQVDVTSGSFVFSSSKAYMIENGKITHPVKDFSLIGKGSDVLKSISMVGNNLKLDDGSGTCSKDGQQVPVGVGQPTVKIDCITVGGTGL